jgi:hypothetical protein
MTAAAGIGHDRGPAMDAGVSWRRHSWAQVRGALLAALPPDLPRAGVMLIGAAPGECAWREAGRLGSYLDADRYFAAVG